MSVQPWKLLDETLLAERFGRGLAMRRFRKPDGTEDDYCIYTRKRPFVASCVALTADGNILVIRQFRPGPNRILTELPGGIVDEGQDILAAAQVELLEEIGYQGTPRDSGWRWDEANSTLKRGWAAFDDCVQVGEPEEGIDVFEIPLPVFVQMQTSGEYPDLRTPSAFYGLLALGRLTLA